MRRVKKLLGLCLPVLVIVAMTAVVAGNAAADWSYWNMGYGGNGTWNSSNLNWGPYGGSGSVWVNGDDAKFYGADGTTTIAPGLSPYFVPSVNSLEFVTGNFTITGGSLTMLTNSVSVNYGLSETINSSIGGTAGLTLPGVVHSPFPAPTPTPA